MDSDNGKDAGEEKNRDNVKTKKIGEGEYASIEDSPEGNQLRNTDEVVGTA